MALNKNLETFVIHKSALEAIIIHLSQITQIAILQWDKALTKIPAKYFNYADVFLSDLAIELPENTSLNKHVIKLVDEK